MPPNPHGNLVPSASGGPQPTGADDDDTDVKPVDDDGNADMFANMFETAVGMAAEMAEQQLGIDDEEEGDGAEERAAEDSGRLLTGTVGTDEESGGGEGGSNDEADGL